MTLQEAIKTCLENKNWVQIDTTKHGHFIMKRKKPSSEVEFCYISPHGRVWSNQQGNKPRK